MKRKSFMLLAAACITFLVACTAENNIKETTKQTVNQSVDQIESHTENQAEDQTEAKETTASDPQEEMSYPEEQAESIIHNSPIGYSCRFDPKVIALYDTEEGDSFQYLTREELAMPVYVAVIPYPDMSAAELAQGLALQAGLEEKDIQDTYFGADSLLTKNIYIENDINGLTQIQTFYVVPITDTSSLMIEIGGYETMPDAAEAALLEITGSFSIKQ